MSRQKKLLELLHNLELLLQEHNHWQTQMPSEQALASTEPFAIDTLSPTQWLQWIFIVKMQYLIEQELALPEALSISPYLSETLPEQGKQQIMDLCLQIDALFCGENNG